MWCPAFAGFCAWPRATDALTSAEHAQRTEWTRDTFCSAPIPACATPMPRSWAGSTSSPSRKLIKKLLNKTNITALIHYLDDDVFRPVALLDSYRPLGGSTYMPFVRAPWRYLLYVAALARITHLKLGMHMCRKTYATLKIYRACRNAWLC